MYSRSVTIGFIPSPRGVASVAAEWAASAGSATAPTSGWRPAPPQLTDTARYLWRRDTVLYTDGSRQALPACLVGSLGRDGVGSYQLDLSNENIPIGLVKQGEAYYPSNVIEYRTAETEIFATGGGGGASVLSYELWHRGSAIGSTTSAPIGQYEIEDLGIASWRFLAGKLTIVFRSDKAWAPGSKIDFLIVASVDAEGERIDGLSKGFSVVFQPPGADGVTPLIYDLVPAEGSLAVDSAGHPRKASVSCAVRKSYGDATEILSTASRLEQEGLELKCWLNGVAYASLSEALAVSTPATMRLSSLEWQLWRGGELIDREDIAVASDGAKGEDGISPESYRLVPSPDAVTIGADGAPSEAVISCSVRVDQGESHRVLSTIAECQAEGLGLRLVIDDARAIQWHSFDLASYSGLAALQSLAWRLLKGGQIIDEASVAIARDGQPGAPGTPGRKGAIVRTRRWEDVPTAPVIVGGGYSITDTICYPGAEGDEWLDIAVVGEAFYRCARQYQKMSRGANAGKTPADLPAYFEPIASWPSLATDLMLAKKAYIKHLGAEYVYLEDPETREVVFSVDVVDGKATVACNTGSFRNIVARDIVAQGSVRADFLSLGLNDVSGGGLLSGAFNVCVWSPGGNGNPVFFLPELAEGQSAQISLMVAPTTEPTYVSGQPHAPLVDLCGDTDAVLLVSQGRLWSAKGRMQMDYTGLYRFDGWRAQGGETTYWNVSVADGAATVQVQQREETIGHTPAAKPWDIWRPWAD